MKKEPTTINDNPTAVPKHWVGTENLSSDLAFQFMINEGFFSADVALENYAGNYTYKGTLPEGIAYNGKKYFSLMFMSIKDKSYFK